MRLGAPAAPATEQEKPASTLTASAAAPAATAGQGVGEQKASVESNGQTPAANSQFNTDASLPTNHPLTKAQQKILKQQQEKAAKLAKKNGTAAKTGAGEARDRGSRNDHAGGGAG